MFVYGMRLYFFGFLAELSMLVGIRQVGMAGWIVTLVAVSLLVGMVATLVSGGGMTWLLLVVASVLLGSRVSAFRAARRGPVPAVR